MNLEPEIDCDRILEIMDKLGARYKPMVRLTNRGRCRGLIRPACLEIKAKFHAVDLSMELARLVGDKSFDYYASKTIRPRGLAAKFLLARHKLLS